MHHQRASQNASKKQQISLAKMLARKKGTRRDKKKVCTFNHGSRHIIKRASILFFCTVINIHEAEAKAEFVMKI